MTKYEQQQFCVLSFELLKTGLVGEIKQQELILAQHVLSLSVYQKESLILLISFLSAIICR